jgi:NADPH:quinone reductase-like Zn-dependent oxidoreductase
MKAIRIHSFGGPEVLNLEEIPRPIPQPGEVLIQQAATSVNPVDWKARSGFYHPTRAIALPWIPGVDGSGRVVEIGPGITAFKIGDAVFGPVTGAYAQYVKVAAANLQKKPDKITLEEAAAVPVAAITAWQIVIEVAKAYPGQQILIQGAAGGVGHFAVQFARWKGAYIIGTASARNADFLRSISVDKVIDYQSTAFENEVHDLDAVIDTVGGEVFRRSLSVVRRGGTLVTVGAQPEPGMGTNEGVNVIRGGRAPIEKFAQIAALLSSGQIKPFVGSIFPFEQSKEAQVLSQGGHLRGKIILQISNLAD